MEEAEYNPNLSLMAEACKSLTPFASYWVKSSFLIFTHTPSFSFYKVRTQIKIQTLRSLTNNLRINFYFCSVNLIWLDLSSNILSNDYMFITIKNII
jgi:hypothetical protein